MEYLDTLEKTLFLTVNTSHQTTAAQPCDSSLDFALTLRTLVNRCELTVQQMTSVCHELLADRLGDAEAAALLIALRMKGESAAELAAAAQYLRSQMLTLDVGGHNFLDTCGTGGDDSGTFNISTAAAIVSAGAGVPVVKHGNRAVSSRTGSADVLAELGVNWDGSPDRARETLQRAGLVFCFAPHFHPGLKGVATLRKRLGVRTMFNLLGPLLNPAGADYQLLGVGRPELLDRMAGALSMLGIRQAYLVWGEDQLDEVSLSAVTHYRHVQGKDVSAGTWTPDDFGLATCARDELTAADAAESARIILSVLRGERNAARRIVVANAAAALLAADRVADVKAGVSQAEAAIDSGRAMLVLDRLRK